MQAAVERVFCRLNRTQPMHDAASTMQDGASQDQAAQLAAQLLENYRDLLADRSRNTENSQQG
jgi:hypothetical protein